MIIKSVKSLIATIRSIIADARNDERAKYDRMSREIYAKVAKRDYGKVSDK